MAKIFISEIQCNQEIETTLVVSDMQLRVARNGTPFLTLKLVDKTGEITGRIWERAEEISKIISTKRVVSLRGRSEKFRDEMQLQISEIVPLPPSAVDPSDFLPVCPLDGEELFQKLKKAIARVKRQSLHQLMRLFLGDRELMERFKLAPAAKSMHHAYLGGLLEHTVSVAELVVQIAAHYSELDRDLLICGAILHDIGKVEEFVYDLTIDYSHSGRLLGHMVLGIQILEEKVRAMKGFPAEDELLLKHLILSHHGETDLGAVRLPMTREAFVLHFADDLDAKMNSLGRILSESREGAEGWTPFQPLFERFFFRGLPTAPAEGEAVQELPPQDPQGTQLSIWSLSKSQKAGG